LHNHRRLARSGYIGSGQRGRGGGHNSVLLKKKGSRWLLAVQDEQNLNRIGTSLATYGYCLFRMGFESPAVGIGEKGAEWES
jgi:hypothetical protein